jgi:hypothetical protein
VKADSDASDARQLAFVAVTTDTELGVATPWIASGAEGGTSPEGGGAAAGALPPPHAVTRNNTAAVPTMLRRARCDVRKINTSVSIKGDYLHTTLTGVRCALQSAMCAKKRQRTLDAPYVDPKKSQAC